MSKTKKEDQLELSINEQVALGNIYVVGRGWIKANSENSTSSETDKIAAAILSNGFKVVSSYVCGRHVKTREPHQNAVVLSPDEAKQIIIMGFSLKRQYRNIKNDKNRQIKKLGDRLSAQGQVVNDLKSLIYRQKNEITFSENIYEVREQEIKDLKSERTRRLAIFCFLLAYTVALLICYFLK